MPLLPDREAVRISDEVARCSDRATMTRWIRALLEDREARSALILRLARELHHARQRLAQAARYLDGLLKKAQRGSHGQTRRVREAVAMGIDRAEHGLTGTPDFVPSKEWGVCPSGARSLALRGVEIGAPKVRELQQLLIEERRWRSEQNRSK